MRIIKIGRKDLLILTKGDGTKPTVKFDARDMQPNMIPESSSLGGYAIVYALIPKEGNTIYANLTISMPGGIIKVYLESCKENHGRSNG